MKTMKLFTSKLESAFVKIQSERMSDVPILNNALRVQAVGFREWKNYYLGVLITPWFMNLMMLSKDDSEWNELSSGCKITHVFPSGSYEFIRGEEQGIGNYLMCSLFSPVFEFDSHDIAVATANAVMESLMDENCQDEVSTREQTIQKIWNGEQVDDLAEPVVNTDNEEHLRAEVSVSKDKKISRRNLMRGEFSHHDH